MATDSSSLGDSPAEQSFCDKAMELWLNVASLISAIVFSLLNLTGKLVIAALVGSGFVWFNFTLSYIYAKCFSRKKDLIFPKTFDYLIAFISAISVPMVLFGSPHFIMYYLGMISPTIIAIVILTKALMKQPIQREYVPVLPGEDERIAVISDEVYFKVSLVCVGFFSTVLLCNIVVAVLQLPLGLAYFILTGLVPNILLGFVMVPTCWFSGRIFFSRIATEKYGPDWLAILYPDLVTTVGDSVATGSQNESMTESLTEPLLPERDVA